MELLKKTAKEQRKALLNKEISAVELLEQTYKQIEEKDGQIGAYNSLTKEQALEIARIVDKKIANGEELPPMAGIPLALKDNMNMKGSKTTASSKILENFVSPFDATVTKKLRENLVPIVGKANLDEFAMGSSNENSAFKIVRNPHNLNKVPGGSSGGSAASVAAYEATVSLGSDTGGSIRLPASFCGINGFKPTYGRVSRYGLIAFASSLDQVGVFTKDVQDVFKAAQDGGFKIYEAAGYSFRGMNNGSGSGNLSHHSYGIAIDINVTENYSHRGNTVYAGSFWNPASSEYSIPRDGILVKAFEAKGWEWGGNWSGNYQDYMHFSFTGN